MKLRKQSQVESKPSEPPLVERVNTLSLEEFIVQYVSRDTLEAKLSFPSESQDDGGENGQSPRVDEEQQRTYSLQIHSSESIPKADLDACFNLVQLTSSEAYKQSSVGWSTSKKRKEMKLVDMRYMLVRRSRRTECEAEPEEDSNQVEGFLSFMVTYEDGVEVIYCYEIHLAPSVRSKGLGKRLIHFYEEIGRNVGVEKAMLTVFKSNDISLRFYEKLGYEEDEFSPRPKRLRNGVVKEPDYMILSKRLRERIAK